MRNLFDAVWGYVFYGIITVIALSQLVQLIELLQGPETITYDWEGDDDVVYHRAEEPLKFYLAAIANSIGMLLFFLFWLIITVFILLVKFKKPKELSPEELARFEKTNSLSEMFEEAQKMAEEKKTRNQ
jgi:hypothetical protein